MKNSNPSRSRRTSARNFSRTAAIAASILAPVLAGMTLTACKTNSKPASAVKGAECVGTWLGTFIGAIPLPGFSSLGTITQATAKTVAGTLRSVGSDSVKDTCGAASNFSSEQMQQMKGAIKDGFNDQNHMEAIALMNKIETKLREFVPDQERFTPYTISNLQSIIDDANDWWSKYDQSGTRIYNVQDFVIVTGYIMKAYQHMIREVALEASQTRSAGDAQKVRAFAENLSRKADHARKELQEIANNDTAGLAKTFWKDGGSKQTKTYYAYEMEYAHCYESKDGKPYISIDQERISLRSQRFLDGLRGSKSLNDLSRFASNNGTICCTSSSGCKDDEAIEPVIAKYLDEASKQVRQVMFFNNADMMKYIDEVLPLFISAAQRIKESPDDAIFVLAADSSSTANTGSNGSGGNSQGSGASTCPDGDNGQGRGYGDIYQCGDRQCAKTDKSYLVQCEISK